MLSSDHERIVLSMTQDGAFVFVHTSFGASNPGASILLNSQLFVASYIAQAYPLAEW